MLRSSNDRIHPYELSTHKKHKHITNINIKEKRVTSRPSFVGNIICLLVVISCMYWVVEVSMVSHIKYNHYIAAEDNTVDDMESNMSDEISIPSSESVQPITKAPVVAEILSERSTPLINPRGINSTAASPEEEEKKLIDHETPHAHTLLAHNKTHTHTHTHIIIRRWTMIHQCHTHTYVTL
eukprot:GHVR01168021.1.p2 GENE.GHVR01168021.1~~GHVR01168021.1.p2  ORF type:complete len:182 (+),score=56.97 GHVR01168021.1:92-637(+)